MSLFLLPHWLWGILSFTHRIQTYHSSVVQIGAWLILYSVTWKLLKLSYRPKGMEKEKHLRVTICMIKFDMEITLPVLHPYLLQNYSCCLNPHVTGGAVAAVFLTSMICHPSKHCLLPTRDLHNKLARFLMVFTLCERDVTDSHVWDLQMFTS